MTIHQLHHLKPLLNLRVLADEAALSYEALAAKLYRFGVQGRRSELTAPESQALDRALARLLSAAGLVVTRPSDLPDTAHAPTAP